MKHIFLTELLGRFTNHDILMMTTATEKTTQQMKDRAKRQYRRTRGLTMVIAVETYHPRIRRIPSINSKETTREP